MAAVTLHGRLTFGLGVQSPKETTRTLARAIRSIGALWLRCCAMLRRAIKLGVGIGATTAAAGIVLVDGFLVRVALALVAKAREAAPYTFDSDLAADAIAAIILEEAAKRLESEAHNA